MREILFRGKMLDTGTWVEGAFCLKDCDDPFGELQDRPSIIKYAPPHDGYWFRVIPETVGQLTGLFDKNGMKIFEGDVVRFTSSPGFYSYVGEVVFRKGAFCIKYKPSYSKTDHFHRIGETDRWQDMGASGDITHSYELMGNIHDNPELLAADSTL